jgi:hypothetical protein
LLLCPGLDLCHLWCCLCLGGILQQWQKRALILNCHYHLGGDVIWSGRQVLWFWRNVLHQFQGRQISILQQEAAHCSETLVPLHQTRWSHIPKNSNFHGYCRQNLNCTPSPVGYLSWLLLSSCPPSAGTQHTQCYSAVTPEMSQ